MKGERYWVKRCDSKQKVETQNKIVLILKIVL